MSFSDFGAGRRNQVSAPSYEGSERLVGSTEHGRISVFRKNESASIVTASSSGSRSSADDHMMPPRTNRPPQRAYGDDLAAVRADMNEYQKMVYKTQDLNGMNGANDCRSDMEKLASRIEQRIAYLVRLDRVGERTPLAELQKDFRQARLSYQEAMSRYRRHVFASGHTEGHSGAMSDNLNYDVGQNQYTEQMKVDREEEYARHVMREREEEMQQINMKVHKVNEIYKDLGELVSSQQDQIDKLEDNIEESKDYAKKGLGQFEEANQPSRWRQQSNKCQPENTDGTLNGEAQNSAGFNFSFDALREDMSEMQKVAIAIGSSIMRKGKIMVLGCTGMGDISNSPML